MESSWTLALVEYSCEDVPSRTTQNYIEKSRITGKYEIGPNIWPESCISRGYLQVFQKFD